MSRVVDHRITVQCKPSSQSRRRGASGRQQSGLRYGQWTGLHRGLRRAGHGNTGETRELGRATGLLVTRPEEQGYRLTKSPGAGRELPAVSEPLGGTQTEEA